MYFITMTDNNNDWCLYPNCSHGLKVKVKCACEVFITSCILRTSFLYHLFHITPMIVFITLTWHLLHLVIMLVRAFDAT